jgi:hypothetical protein
MIQIGGAAAPIPNKYMNYVKLALKGVVIVIGLFFLLISIPAAPIIIYLTILFNVIKLVFDRIKNL